MVTRTPRGVMPVRGAARRRWEQQDGAAAVEFALVLPLLVLFVFGTLQFGLFFYRWQGIQSMAHEGARGAAIGLTVAEVEDRVEGAMSIPAQYADVEIAVVLIDTTTDTEVQRIDGKTTNAALQATAICGGLANPSRYVARVEVGLDDTISDYEIQIPIFGTIETDYGSAVTFTCEAVP